MKNNHIRVFFGGDVFGESGMRAVLALLPAFISREGIDFCLLNGENGTGGIGLSEEDAQRLFAAGADCITGGNHSFEKRDFWPVLENLSGMLRPANFPQGMTNMPPLPGRGMATFEKGGRRFTVINLQGREHMSPIDCPFRCVDSLLASLGETQGDQGKPIVLVDFHAESNDEKEALGLYLDGRVSALVGTHTHVQTADEKILRGGTAYMTDLGMTGPVSSVIGADPEGAVKRNLTQVLYRMETAGGPAALRGLLVDIDPATARAVGVARVNIKEGD